MRLRLGWIVILLAVFMGATARSAFSQWAASNYFDTGWTATNQTGFMDQTDGVWTGSSVRITTSLGKVSPDYACALNDASATTNSWIQSPFLPEGAGVISFHVKRAQTSGTNIFVLERSFDGAIWSVLPGATYTNAVSASFTNITYPVNAHTGLFLRLRKTTEMPLTSALYLVIDNIEVGFPPVAVTITNVTTQPAFPEEGQGVSIQASAIPLGVISNLALTAYWRAGIAGGWTAIGMASNAPNSYATTGAIPGQAAGVTVQYYIGATFQGRDATPTNFPAAGSNAPLSYLVAAKSYSSAYEHLWVEGHLATNLYLVADSSWQGVATATGPTVNAAFRFVGVTTNVPPATNRWGEADQSDFDLLIDGTAESFINPATTNIVMPGTNTGQFVFTFNDTNLAYSVNQCWFQDFDAWPTNGVFTNGGWIVSGGLVVHDTNRMYRFRSAQITNSGSAYLRSTLLPEGIGEISFQYRNWQTNGNPATRCVIQKSVTGGPSAGEWVTIHTLTNINNAAFNQFRLTVEDRQFRYARILVDTTNATLCLDEVLIGAPYYSGVAITNLTHQPTAPTATNSVTVSAEIRPLSGASNVTATLYYRSGTNDAFTPITMTHTGGFQYVTSSPIPAGIGPDGGAGIVQYYVQCDFQGYQSSLTSPSFAPALGSNGPSSCVIARSSVAVSGLQPMPSPPLLYTNTGFEVFIEPQAVASGISATLYYRLGDAGGFSALPMIHTGVSNRYVTVGSIPPQNVAGQPLYYYLTAQFAGANPISPTNFPVGGAPGLVTYLRLPPYASAYTNVAASGSITNNLLLASNGFWRGVAVVNALTNGSFVFVGQNGGLTLWGDSNPPATNPPLDGVAQAGGSNIVMAGAYSGPLMFTFDESSGVYAIRRGAYVNFDDWAVTTYGVHTNADGWVLWNGRATAGGAETSQTFQATGRSGVLNGQPNTNGLSFIRSPYLEYGIGEISFRYRNWETDAVPPAAFAVQVAASPTSTTWQTIATVTNILTQDFVEFSVARSDREHHAVRIVGNPFSGAAQLLLDEIMIAEPMAGVAFTNLTHSPPSPTVLDPVEVSVEISPVLRASNLSAVVWFRQGTNNYDYRLMTNDYGNHFVTVTPLPNAGTGTVQYYVTCAYEGFDAQRSSPAAFPIGAPSNVAGYVVDPPDMTPRVQYFDTGWTPSNQLSFFDQGDGVWTGANVRITGSVGFQSSPYSCLLNDANVTTNSWIRSPWLTNGVGTVYFGAKNNKAGFVNTFVVESSTNGETWSVVQTLTSTGTTFSAYACEINRYEAMYVRLRKLSDTTTDAFLVLDNIEISYPPAQISISDVGVSPGYPSTSDYVQVSCVITSAFNPFFPAFGMTPEVWHRASGTTNFSGPVPMQRVSGDTYVTVGGIPPYPRDTLIEYFVRCYFSGYAYNAAENRSPTHYPPAGATAPTNLGVTVRTFKSEFGTVNGTVNGLNPVSSRMISDRLWQSVVQLPAPTNALRIAFAGLNQSVGYGYTTNIARWGDTNAWKPDLPLASVATTGDHPIVISGQFDGQIVVRFNDQTGEYSVQRCLWQDFDTWAPTEKYIRTLSDNTPPYTNNFNDWPANEIFFRTNWFTESGWTNYTAYTSGVFVGFFGIYDARFRTDLGAIQLTNSSDRGYLVHANQGANPLQGVGTVSFKFRPNSANATNQPIGLKLVLAPTNAWTDQGQWVTMWSTNGVTNWTAMIPQTVTINTSATMAVVWAHTYGDESVILDEISVTDWYADTKTNAYWIAWESWISTNVARSGHKCELNRRRAEVGREQFVQTPRLTNGCTFIDFWYGGMSPSVSISFDLQISAAAEPLTWTTLRSVTNILNGTYTNFSYAVLTNADVYLRIKNTTADTSGQGILLLDDIRVSWSKGGGNWEVNNGFVDAAPGSRAYYMQPCYLNSNRTADVDFALTLTNLVPYVQSPALTNGIGEISFWYRNWAVGGPVTPARLVVQKSVTGSTNHADWTTVAIITGIVNTADYNYFSTSIYDTVSRYVRIYNDDLSGPVGRVSLDDILITAPLAASISMSNLVVQPGVPLDSDPVDVLVDVYNPFLSPSNLVLYAYWAAATNYGGWGTYTPILMSCVASNPAARWYRFKTTAGIPSQAVDTFVSYYVRAWWDGLHSLDTTPRTFVEFTTPSWYYPLNYGTSNAYYIVYSCTTGAVWINEINSYDYDRSDAYEYVELCGQAGARINNWKLEFVNTAGLIATNGAYVPSFTITNNTTLANEVNGYGFWLLGDTNVPGCDMHFPSSPSDAIPKPNGGMRLVRSSGAWEQRVAYGSLVSLGTLTNLGYEYIGEKDLDAASPLALVGSGGTYRQFDWTNYAGGYWNYTPGSQNVEQLFYSNLTHLITATAGAGGAITPSGDVYVAHRANASFNMLPNTGWHVTDVVVDGASIGPSNSYTFFDVQTNHTIAVSFAVNVYDITATAGFGGAIMPSGTVQVAHGGGTNFLVTVTQPGWHIADIRTNGTSIGWAFGNSATITNFLWSDIAASGSIHAFFTTNIYTIAASSTLYGVVAPSGAVSVVHGANQSFALTPDPGASVTDVVVDGQSIGPTNAYTFLSVTNNRSLYAVFAMQQFALTATNIGPGQISPSGVVWVAYGEGTNFVISATNRQRIFDIRTNGVSLGWSFSFDSVWTNFTWANVTSNGMIEAWFTNWHTLAVASAHGGAWAPVGVHTGDAGSVWTLAVTNSPMLFGGTQYVCIGWAASGSVPTNTVPGPGATNTGSFALTEDSGIVWQWATNYHLGLTALGSGTLAPMSGWQAAGSVVAVTATPSLYWHFGAWSGDTNGCAIAGPVLDAAMTQARYLTAQFLPNLVTNAPTPVPEWWLAAYGLTNPSFAAQNTNDFDDDLHFSWEEYITGTDPTNPHSVLKIVLQETRGGTSTVRWLSATGAVTTPYVVQWSTNLLSAGWMTATSNVPRDPPTNTFIWVAPVTGPPVFYRVVVTN